MLDLDDRYLIEERLGRELTADELTVVPALDRLSQAQLEVDSRTRCPVADQPAMIGRPS